MKPLYRYWQALIARLCWLEIDALKRQRKHQAKVIIGLEAQLQHERLHLNQLDHAIKLTGMDATRAAMRGQM